MDTPELILQPKRRLFHPWILPLLLLAALCIAAFYIRTDYLLYNQWLWFWSAGLIGFCVGLSELLNRYKAFRYIFSNNYSWVYMGINMLAGMAAYALIIKYNINLGDIGKFPVGKSIAAGIGAMAFLRSSLFSYKDSANKPIDVGPAALLNVVLHATERQFDQVVTRKTLIQVEPIMKGIDFISASKDLPELINRSMRVLSPDEQSQLSSEILKLLNDNSITEATKCINLGMIMEKYTGIPLLRDAVDTLRRIYDENKSKFVLENIRLS
ncbi:MAG: hypothetical protein Q8941_04870 [Bacteroidota bacterium]|nr:hypothetical protein [Bacteroidota bacterium]